MQKKRNTKRLFIYLFFKLCYNTATFIILSNMVNIMVLEILLIIQVDNTLEASNKIQIFRRVTRNVTVPDSKNIIKKFRHKHENN